MQAGVAQIGVHQQHCVFDFHGQTDSQVERGQRFPLTGTGAGDGEHIPVVFFQPLQDLGAQHLVRIGKGTGIKARDYTFGAQFRCRYLSVAGL